MSVNAERFKSLLDSKEIRYEYFLPNEKRNEAISISYNGNHGNTLKFIFFFDEDGHSVNVKCFSIAVVPNEKLMDMYVKMNEINNEYRWIKFYIDSDNEVTAAGDAIIDEETADEECLEILLRYLHIVNDIYPSIMKIVWA